MGRAAIKLKIARANPRPPDFKRTKGDTVPGEFLIIVVSNFDVDAKNRLTHVRSHLGKRLRVILMTTGTG